MIVQNQEGSLITIDIPAETYVEEDEEENENNKNNKKNKPHNQMQLFQSHAKFHKWHSIFKRIQNIRYFDCS